MIVSLCVHNFQQRELPKVLTSHNHDLIKCEDINSRAIQNDLSLSLDPVDNSTTRYPSYILVDRNLEDTVGNEWTGTCLFFGSTSWNVIL